jgi:hypothetical protein
MGEPDRRQHFIGKPAERREAIHEGSPGNVIEGVRRQHCLICQAETFYPSDLDGLPSHPREISGDTAASEPGVQRLLRRPRSLADNAVRRSIDRFDTLASWSDQPWSWQQWRRMFRRWMRGGACPLLSRRSGVAFDFPSRTWHRMFYGLSEHCPVKFGKICAAWLG